MAWDKPTILGFLPASVAQATDFTGKDGYMVVWDSTADKTVKLADQDDTDNFAGVIVKGSSKNNGTSIAAAIPGSIVLVQNGGTAITTRLNGIGSNTGTYKGLGKVAASGKHYWLKNLKAIASNAKGLCVMVWPKAAA